VVWIEMIVDVLGYATARVLLPLLTFGTVRVGRPSPAAIQFGWHGFGRASNGIHVCRAGTASWLGLIPWAVGVIIAIVVVRG
jgi:hypothetical protein